jgi:hypothetical protein
MNGGMSATAALQFTLVKRCARTWGASIITPVHEAATPG